MPSPSLLKEVSVQVPPAPEGVGAARVMSGFTVGRDHSQLESGTTALVSLGRGNPLGLVL